MPSKQGRDWCFTDYECSRIPELLKLECQYIIFQKEECPETGKEHLQGFIQMKKRMTLAGMKKFMGSRVHFETRKGTAQQAADYCQKVESRVEGPWSAGEMSSQGKSKNLLKIKKMIDDGAETVEVAEAEFPTWCRNHRAIESYRQMKAKKRAWPMENYCWWGDAGAGKTRAAWAKEEDLYAKPAGKWFDGYAGQEAVLLDDFTGDMDLSLFLKVLDRYPLRVEVKGGTCSFLAKRIYVTSNLSPEEWYPKANATQHAAIRRRFTEIKRWRTGAVIPAAADCFVFASSKK